MKKAASIFLRAEITPRDVEWLIQWMGDPQVTRYLHEETDIVQSLRRLLVSVPAPMLTFQFNRWGRFFMVCCQNDGSAIGFVKLKPLSSPAPMRSCMSSARRSSGATATEKPPSVPPCPPRFSTGGPSKCLPGSTPAMSALSGLSAPAASAANIRTSACPATASPCRNI
mgnify:FL=1